MEVIDGNWYMEGLEYNDPRCIRSSGELLEVIERLGFLPLFSNKVPGFSVESMTCATSWWTDSDSDPWKWREELSRSDRVAYGKFFGNKAGYVSRDWFPRFANYRRDGYDFDALWSDGLAGYREKLLMDLFVPEDTDMWEVKSFPAIFTNEMKEQAGFGKNGYKNFEGNLAKLQMRSYLIDNDLVQRLNKKGESFGWAVARMTPPEARWGYGFVTRAYEETKEESKQAITEHLHQFFPDADFKRLIF